MKISVAVITRNAAADLERCLRSVAFADEIVVLDQDSTDGTDEVCSHAGATVHQTEWLGFGPTKQKAVSLCRNRWVLSLDSDEEVSAELQAAITALPEDTSMAAFAVNRLSSFLGVWIHHCGWHPEYIVRLFDTQRAQFNDKVVHEAVETEGRIKRLPGLVFHYTYATFEAYVQKMNLYSTLWAKEAAGRGRRVSLAGAVVRSNFTFWRMWLWQGGFLDRWPGTVLCLVSGFYTLGKYTKLRQLNREEDS
ncbi:MAG: glycosyltransferase family 2 protein [Gemmatimonadales bacterium]|nr:glycosyltransferase family 2 protein [Gemmatimonadales bacterium]